MDDVESGIFPYGFRYNLPRQTHQIERTYCATNTSVSFRFTQIDGALHMRAITEMHFLLVSFPSVTFFVSFVRMFDDVNDNALSLSLSVHLPVPTYVCQVFTQTYTCRSHTDMQGNSRRIYRDREKGTFEMMK